MDKKKLATRFLLRLFGVMLTLGVVFGTFSAMEADVSAADKTVTNPSKKETRALVKKIVKANKTDKILKNHKSYFYVDEDMALWFDKESAYLRSFVAGNASCFSGDKGYVMDWKNGRFEYSFIVGGLDMYDLTDVTPYFDEIITVDRLLEDKAVSIEYDSDKITLTRMACDNSKKEFFEGRGEEVPEVPVYEAIIVDLKTYEIVQCYEYLEENGEKNILLNARVFYDVDEPAEYVILRGMGERKTKETITCTIVRDAGTENEIRVEATIPAGSSIRVYSKGTDHKFYKNAKCTKEYGKWTGLEDTVIYMKTDSGADE